MQIKLVVVVVVVVVGFAETFKVDFRNSDRTITAL